VLNRLSPTNIPDATVDEAGFDLWEVISFVWREWKLIAQVVALTLLAGVVYVLSETPRYTASADILLEPRKERAPGESILSDTNLDFAMIEGQMAIIRSSVFLRRVVEKERLYSDPEFGSVPEPESSILARIRSLFFFFGGPAEIKSRSAKPETPASDASINQSINALKGAVAVSRGMTQLYVLSISVKSADPVRAARLANAVADAYVVEKLDARLDTAKRSSAWLTDRLAELRTQLRESEEAVAKYRAENSLIQGGANVTLSQQQLSELNAKMVTARADTADKKARLDLLQSIEASGGNIQSLPDLGTGGGALASLRLQLAAISQREADLVARYTNSHPLVVNVRAERRDVERAIVAEIKQLSVKVKNEYELAKSKEAATEQSLREATGQTGADNKTTIMLRELERTAAVNKSLFEDFLQKAKITQEQATFEARDVRIITPAQPPGAQSSPRIFQSVVVILFIGLMLGVGGALAKERLNTGFTTPLQAEQMLDLPLLASVYRMGKRATMVDGKITPIAFCPVAMPQSRFSEVMRMLRVGIQMTDVDSPAKIIQVTSTLPNEGKTTIALSLASSAAASNLKVLFIDADMREPSASRFFNIDKERGLVDLLLDNVNPHETIKYNEVAKFWVLTAGREPQNPTDLLSSERMRSLLRLCRQTFDYVVIDTPPVGPFADPLIISRLVDKTVYVVRWSATAREMVKHSIQQFSEPKQIAGIVYNFVNEGEARKYGKDAYSYYYSNTYKKYYNQ
jgi:succinoglycan biosynthesis transport protein ExoP